MDKLVVAAQALVGFATPVTPVKARLDRLAVRLGDVVASGAGRSNSSFASADALLVQAAQAVIDARGDHASVAMLSAVLDHLCAMAEAGKPQYWWEKI